MSQYQTPGVHVEEIASGPRPVEASSTTDTGFVGVLTLPEQFFQSRPEMVRPGDPSRGLIPNGSGAPLLTWNRALAFDALNHCGANAGGTDSRSIDDVGGTKKVKAAEGEVPVTRIRPVVGEGNRLENLVTEVLGKWTVCPRDPTRPNSIVIASEKGTLLRIPARPTLFSTDGDRWDLAASADPFQALSLIASHALQQGVAHSGSLSCLDEKPATLTPPTEKLARHFMGEAERVDSMDAFAAWRDGFAERLYTQIRSATLDQADVSTWDGLALPLQEAWNDWVRRHPGMFRVELALRGFLENGGRTAFIAMTIQGSEAAADKTHLLHAAFDGITSLAIIAAPGLNYEWQESVLAYAGPRQRKDLFVVLDTPRHLLTREPHNQPVREQKPGEARAGLRWPIRKDPYEGDSREVLAENTTSELRLFGFASDAILDRSVPRDEAGHGAAYGPWIVVDNPLSLGPHDRYIVAPPSGHVAGMIAATDLKPGGGVQKAPATEQLLGGRGLTTNVPDNEQTALNPKGINIIRFRPYAGIRGWGARTVGSQPLWKYINVRRLLLMIERSVRNAVQWAVFLPNTDQTRADIKGMTAGFLFRLNQVGRLNGRFYKDSFEVRCDRDNNTESDVGVRILTVDVSIRPGYPAESIRLRFRQTPMMTEISEN